MSSIPDAVELSVIIPTRDRPGQLARCLDALTHQTFPLSRIEVLVVDDGSLESLSGVVDPYRDRLHLSLLRQPQSGPGRARNRGAQEARGRFLAFTDDDCYPASEWLERLAETLHNAPEAVVGGPTVNALRENIYAAASQALIEYLYDYFNHDPGKFWFLASSNLAILADSFRSIGGFDPAYPTAAAEDRDLCARLRASGRSMRFSPGAVVFHSHSLDFVSFCRQHFAYGRGARRYWRARLANLGARPRIEPPRFYLGLLASPLRDKDLRRPLAVSALLLLSQGANAAGFAWEWLLERR